MDQVNFLNPDDNADGPTFTDMNSIAAVARLGHEPHNQLTALRQFLGVNRLLHCSKPAGANRASEKDKFQFISICSSCIGPSFSTLFPDLSSDQIYEVPLNDIWTAVVNKLSTTSNQSPARMRLELHTLARENFPSMKAFCDRVNQIVRKLRAAGKTVTDDEVKGVLILGVDQDLYAIQIDRWTTNEDDFSVSTIADELIVLEREHAKRAVPSTYALVAARNVLERRGLTVVDPTIPQNPQPAPQQQSNPVQSPPVESPPTPAWRQRGAPTPAPARSPAPTRKSGRPHCPYCSKLGHSEDVCFVKMKDLRDQIKAMDAACSAKQLNVPQSALLTVPEAPAQPAPLKAEVSGKADSYFKTNVVPSKQFWY